MKQRQIPHRWLLLAIPLATFLAVAGYLAWTYANGLLGFPLDDAWIHQTYARNLAETGQLAYLPGQPCSGHTSRSIAALLGFPPV
jgi:hypothetical protein